VEKFNIVKGGLKAGLETSDFFLQEKIL